MNPDFWRGKAVFLTGHTGFKGSWLTLWLARMGASVHGYALEPPSDPNLFLSAGIERVMASSRIADVRDLDTLSRALAESRADVVIHMAAQALVRPSYEDPVGTFATNVMGTVNLLEAVRRAPAPPGAVLVVTTDKCYENREWHWGYRETEAMGGYDPYSSSKGCAELVVAAWRRSFFQDGGPALASARAGNVIGGGDWARDRLVPDVATTLARAERPLIRFPDAVRPWQHVLEPLSGYLTLCERLHRREPVADAFNFGPADGDARPVRHIADRLCALWGEGAAWRTDAQPQPHEATYLKLDISKARAGLGWVPVWDLETALSRVVEWYRGYYGGDDARILTEAQIDAYQQQRGGLS